MAPFVKEDVIDSSSEESSSSDDEDDDDTEQQQPTAVKTVWTPPNSGDNDPNEG